MPFSFCHVYLYKAALRVVALQALRALKTLKALQALQVQQTLSIHSVINPRCACTARVTLVVLCLCQCVHGSNLLVTQLRDKLVILTGSVSCSLQNEFGVFRIMASFLR